MASAEPTTLQSFHRFLSKQLESNSADSMSPEEALALWQEEQETLSAIREGLADVEAGRTMSIVEFEQAIRQKFGFKGTA